MPATTNHYEEIETAVEFTYNSKVLYKTPHPDEPGCFLLLEPDEEHPVDDENIYLSQWGMINSHGELFKDDPDFCLVHMDGSLQDN